MLSLTFAAILACAPPQAPAPTPDRAPQDDPAAEQPSNIERFLGVWEAQTRDGIDLLSIERSRVVRKPKKGGPVEYYYARLLDDRVELYRYGSVQTLTLRTDGKSLLIKVSEFEERDFTPSRKSAASLAVRPVPCPSPRDVKVSDDQVANWTTELVERGERDQEIRRRLGKGNQSDVLAEMRRIDEENTAFIRELMATAGWPDSRRFGDDAANAAFLLVQHSGDLPLMWTAREALRTEVRGNRFAVDRLALLHDRLQLSLGYPQRFGSQIHSYEGGVQCLAPLEDPERVDAWRAEADLPPLAEYLQMFEERGKVPEPFVWPVPEEPEAPPSRR